MHNAAMAEHIDGPLNWEQLGKTGRPIVFVHPNPYDHTCWLYQMAHFSTWCRCIGIDLPGYGRSPTASPELTMPDVAQACWEAVDQSTTEPAILVGLSVGSNVILHMAKQRPTQTLAMIHSGCSYRPVKEFVLKRVQEYTEQGVAFRRQHTFEVISPAFGGTDMGRYFSDLFVERNRYYDVQTIIDMFRALGETDPDWLFDIPCPMLIITGSEDNSHAASFDLQKRVGGCELITMEGAGHSCNMEQPWLWDRWAAAFLVKHGLFEPGAMTSVP
jgi:pimeloyl-ACP methyl ester carboxylesterase